MLEVNTMTIELANRLAELRKQKGLSQEELADRLQVSRQAVSKWERGEASPDTDNLIELAKIYDISLDELVGLSSSNNKEENKQRHVHIEDEDGDSVHIDDEGIRIQDEEGNEIHVTDDKVIVNGEEQPRRLNKRQKISIFVSCMTTLLVSIAYVVLGVVLGLWAKAWVLFLLVVIIPSIFDAISTKKPHKFSFAVFVIFTYLLLNVWILETPLWHPLWVMFLTIPVYYAITKFVKAMRKPDVECISVKEHDDEDDD